MCDLENKEMFDLTIIVEVIKIHKNEIKINFYNTNLYKIIRTISIDYKYK